MKILVSAAEISSDLHAGRVLAELGRVLAARGERFVAFGVGGPRLRAEGFESLVDAESLLAMGTTEALGKIPLLRRVRRDLLARCRRERPDVALLVDYPEFHMHLARALGRFGIPVVCYIPPKVWVWRRHRARKLAALYREVLCILPFEVEHLVSQGVNARYVGNPLAEELPEGLSRAEARRDLGVLPDAEVMAILPGSRPSELEHHVPILGAAAAELSKRLRRGGASLEFLLALPESLPAGTKDGSTWESRFRQAFLDAGGREHGSKIRTIQGRSHAVMIAADAGWVKSGTATLEAGVLGLPHAVLYRGGRFSEWIFRKVVRRSFQGPVGLVNLFTGWKPGDPLRVREYLASEATPDALAAEGERLLRDDREIARQREVLTALAERVRGDGGSTPSHEVVRSLLRWAASTGTDS